MGAPMARNIARAGHDVVVWNRTREKAQAVEGVSVADSPAAAVARRRGRRDDALRRRRRRGGLGRDRRRGPRGRDLVAGQHGRHRGDRAAARRRDDPYVDAPVLGTKQPAEDGKLTVLASGPDDALDRLSRSSTRRGEDDPARGGRRGDARQARPEPLGPGAHDRDRRDDRRRQGVGCRPAALPRRDRRRPMDSPYAQLKGKLMLEDAVGDAELPAAAGPQGRAARRRAARARRRPGAGAVRGRALRARPRTRLGDHDMAAVGASVLTPRSVRV